MIVMSHGPRRPKKSFPSERENERPWALDQSKYRWLGA